MKQLFALLPIFSRILFFTACGALGYDFEGSGESSLFKVIVFLFGLLGSGVTIWDMLRKEIPMRRSFWVFVVFLPLVIITLYYVEIAFNDVPSGSASSQLLMMGAFTYTSIVSTIHIAERGLNHCVKWMDVFMLLLTVAAYNSIKSSLSGGYIGMGGATYQELSYNCAFAFNLNLCGILFGNQTERFSVFKSKVFNNVSYGLLLIQLTGCFLGGGRGATIYLVLNALLLLIVSNKLSRTLMSASVFGSILLVGLKVMQESALSGVMGSRIERAFSFIGSDGEVKGDDRFSLYERAWEYCKEYDVMGSGLFRALDEFGNPHNFFMEILTQGGMVYCLFWIIVLCYLFYRTYMLIKTEHEYYFIPIICFPLTMLMFSGSYTISQQFWFFIVYLFTRFERKQI